MIFAQNDGHCLNGADSGAEGCGKREQDLTRLVGNLVTSKLKAKGHTVYNCTVDKASTTREALNSIIAKEKAVNADLFFSIHLNASNGEGHGTEVFTYGGKQLAQATRVLRNIVALGYSNRGIKDGSSLAVVRGTKAPSMLIECCFIDNVADMKMFNADKMANAIVGGLIGVNVVTTINTVAKDNKILLLQQVANRCGIRGANGLKLVEDGLKGANTEAARIKLIAYIKDVTK